MVPTTDEVLEYFNASTLRLSIPLLILAAAIPAWAQATAGSSINVLPAGTSQGVVTLSPGTSKGVITLSSPPTATVLPTGTSNGVVLLRPG